MTDKKLAAVGVKKKHEKTFTVKTYVEKWDTDNTARAHIIHNGTGLKRCGVCGHEIKPGLCVCQNCGASDE